MRNDTALEHWEALAATEAPPERLEISVLKADVDVADFLTRHGEKGAKAMRARAEALTGDVRQAWLDAADALESAVEEVDWALYKEEK